MSSREQFEAWATSRGLPEKELRPYVDGTYQTYGVVSCAWEAWQSSRAVPIVLPNAWDMDLHPDNIKNKFELALESQGYTVAN
jgi:hypothetical protein